MIAPTGMQGTDMARRWPSGAARLVLKEGINTKNAWEVLVSAFDEIEALALVRAAALALAHGDQSKADTAVTDALRVAAPHLMNKLDNHASRKDGM